MFILIVFIIRSKKCEIVCLILSINSDKRINDVEDFIVMKKIICSVLYHSRNFIFISFRMIRYFVIMNFID